jgi:hypothetical protein
MTEKLTLKKLSGELEQLRTQLQELEQRLEHKLAARLEGAPVTAGPETRTASTSGHPTGIDAGHYQRLIEEEAYLIAERRGFQGGDPSQDWTEAQRLVDLRLMQPGGSTQTKVRTSMPLKKTAGSAKKAGTVKQAAAKMPAATK